MKLNVDVYLPRPLSFQFTKKLNNWKSGKVFSVVTNCLLVVCGRWMVVCSCLRWFVVVCSGLRSFVVVASFGNYEN